MALISLEFGLFFCVFFALWWLLKGVPALQNALLTVTSLCLLGFYTNITGVAVLVGFTLWIWLFSHAITIKPEGRTTWLALGIITSVLHLAIWKYAEYFRGPLKQVLVAKNVDVSFLDNDWLLPLGVSYYTFQGIAYLVSCHERGQEERLSLWNLLGFLGLFLTLTSGPIARSQTVTKGLTSYDGQPCGMHDQIKPQAPRRILAPYLALTLILLAVFKKWLLAGWLADIVVKPVFSNPGQYHALDILTAIYGYTLQLFFDFSGYSELVLGLGMLLGLRLPVNFRTPLLAHNLADFWNRWHISLSTWIRDYLYIPLGGSRKGFLRTQANLLIAMVLSGAWHGSTWNFVLWGLLHGLGLVALNCKKRLFGRPDDAGPSLVGKIAGVCVTANFVCFAFLFFAVGTLDEARQILHALIHNLSGGPQNAATVWVLPAMLLLWMLWPLLRVLPQRFALAIDRSPLVFRPAMLLIVLVAIVVFAPSGMPNFIYANF